MKKIINYLSSHKQEITNGLIVTVIGGLLLAFIIWLLSLITSNFQMIITFLELVFQNTQILLSSKNEISNYAVTSYLLVVLGIFLFVTRNLKKNKLELDRTKLQLNEANAQIQTLQNKPLVENLAGLNEKFEIKGTYYSSNDLLKKSKQQISKSYTWEEIFSLLAPYILNVPQDGYVKDNIMGEAFFHYITSAQSSSLPFAGVMIDPQDFQTIKIQLIALRLITVTYEKTTKGDWAWFWRLTNDGTLLVMSLRTIKT